MIFNLQDSTCNANVGRVSCKVVDFCFCLILVLSCIPSSSYHLIRRYQGKVHAELQGRETRIDLSLGTCTRQKWMLVTVCVQATFFCCQLCIISIGLTPPGIRNLHVERPQSCKFRFFLCSFIAAKKLAQSCL